MNTHKPLLFLVLAFILTLTSCTMEKRVYMPGYYVDRHKQKHKLDLAINKNKNKNNHNKNIPSELIENTDKLSFFFQPKNIDHILASIDNSIIPISTTPFKKNKEEYSSTLPKTIYKKKENNKEKPSEDCEIIVLISGEKIKAKVIEIGEDRIKYKLCDNQEGPTVSISRSDVSLIKYPDGTEKIITAEDPNDPSNNFENRRVPGMAVIGFVFSIISFFIAAFILGSLAIVFGIISLIKIKKQAEKYKGRGWAIASIILGILAIIAFLVVMAATLAV